MGLLNQRNRFDEIDHVAQVLRDQGAALDEITIVKALDAIRKQDFDRGIALARQVFPETSTNPSDHLTLGRLYMAAGRSDEAGKEFRRAVELGPGVPESWLTYVQYLVQTKQIDQARAAIEAARQALPADRATLTLAQCSMSVGDVKQAEELIGKALNDEGKSADPTTLRLATIVSLSQNRFDKVNEYLNKLDQVPRSLRERQGLGQPDPRRAALEQGPAGRPGSGARAGRAEPEERSQQHRGPGAQGHHPRPSAQPSRRGHHDPGTTGRRQPAGRQRAVPAGPALPGSTRRAEVPGRDAEAPEPQSPGTRSIWPTSSTTGSAATSSTRPIAGSPS